MSSVLVGLFGTRYLSFLLKAFKRVRVRVRVGSRQSRVPNWATRKNLSALDVFFTPQTLAGFTKHREDSSPVHDGG